MLYDKIETFYKKSNNIFRRPLEKIINHMLNKCKYINGESLERHNWGNKPIKLKNIPTDIKSPYFEENLLKALNLDENEKSIIELLWGDIQLGKRVQACVIMWISVYILKRPVLYIFRNLAIDQKQLHEDIRGTENYNFNGQFIRNLFEEFNGELQEYYKETNVDYYKEYKLPELKDIGTNDTLNKLSNKEAINSNDIFCCLMNHTQLAKINSKFSEYILYNNELIDMTVLVDESDLMAPTSSNDCSDSNDVKDSTACEILLAKIYKKVKYALHITGTAHSLLYNITTRLSENTDIQIKVSKVHKMNRSDNYYGLFNNSINYNTSKVNTWWDCQDIKNHKKIKIHYNIIEDYNKNIKHIIKEILNRPLIKYNSLLISEEKIRINQFSLVNVLLKDFSNLFIVIFHGNCLRLYLSKEYEKEINDWSLWDAQHSTTGPRLWQIGGVYGTAIYTEKSETVPNNYCYFDINTKILNIKLVYKLLRILFEKSKINIKYKTVITITGKYGERGYSFTSDDYDNYSFHLTDQYFISHASFNCTDISQRLRLQGKYNDNELKNGTMKLTLWTTSKLKDIIQNFYVLFIKEIEKNIMECYEWEDIKNLIENIIDTKGEFEFIKYMKYIDVSKKRKNLKLRNFFDKENNGYKLMNINNMNDDEIIEWCKNYGLPDYNCVNEIKEMNKTIFINIYGSEWEIEIKSDLTIEEVNILYKQYGKKAHNPTIKADPDTKYEICSLTTESKKKWDYDELYKKFILNYAHQINIDHFNKHKRLLENTTKKYLTQLLVGYKENGDVRYILKIFKKHDTKINLPAITNDINKIPYIVNADIVSYSVLKEEYKKKNNYGYVNEGNTFIEGGGLPNVYYWLTPNNWLYLFDKDRPEISSNIIRNSSDVLISNNNVPTIDNVPTINNVLLFTNMCCKKTNKHNLRFTLKDIYNIYETWCKINNKKCLGIQKKFKVEFEKLNYKEETIIGIDIHNKICKRGYNLMVSI